jgi:hypothetical protein
MQFPRAQPTTLEASARPHHPRNAVGNRRSSDRVADRAYRFRELDADSLRGANPGGAASLCHVARLAKGRLQAEAREIGELIFSYRGLDGPRSS